MYTNISNPLLTCFKHPFIYDHTAKLYHHYSTAT